MAGQIDLYAATSPIMSTSREQSHRHRKVASLSCTKYFERRLVRAWKHVTRSMRRPERASIMPEGFVLMNSRRRSMYIDLH
ncbi:hypothetical protein EW146_g2880 [Bondarzewia mesenterica]|uniref:Uncharacterized protein n=1 Tax=Bondarzewia mesenterica TaxID=1095465 RepID=A0A4S4M5I7_9AGAM|nr:hypothetical protein EW146_g2880 [Bondarzewia mesenterica]